MMLAHNDAAICNLQAEQDLLGAILINQDAFDRVDGIVSASDFSEDLHRRIFEGFAEARAAGRRIDVTLFKSLIGELSGQDIGGMTVSQYLARLAGQATTVINAPDYARAVAENARYRDLADAGAALAERARQGVSGGTPSQMASDALSTLDDVITSSAVHGARRVSVSEAVKTAYTAYRDRVEHGVVTGIGFGISDLDRVAMMEPGTLTICAARPSMGKTTFGLFAAMSAAKAGHGVVFYSLEMPDVQLGQRVLAAACYTGPQDAIAYSDIHNGRINNAQAQRLAEASENFAGVPLLIEQEASLTAAQIIARARKASNVFAKEGRELGLIVVDHIGLVGTGERYSGQRHLELGAITAALKAAAKDMGVPVLLLCQLNRGTEGRENKRPMLSDLNESGKIEQDADAVLLLYREAYYLERAKEKDPTEDLARLSRLEALKNTVEINVGKNRQGPTRTVEAFVHMPSGFMSGMDRRFA